ncbi:hypothetical protein ABK040_016635 [Willaertia magna]
MLNNNNEKLYDIESGGLSSTSTSSSLGSDSKMKENNLFSMVGISNMVVRNKRYLYPAFFVCALLSIGFTLLFIYSYKPNENYSISNSNKGISSSEGNNALFSFLKQKTVTKDQFSQRTEFPILIVADRDKGSKTISEKGDTIWKSVLLRGLLKRNPETNAYSLQLEDRPLEITGLLVEGSRGMELSELKMFQGKLYSVDDRTGIVYELKATSTSGSLIDANTIKVKAIARHILVDGDGMTTTKGFKCEWATVKDNKLYIGSIGKEWTTPDGKILSHDPMYVKTIDQYGNVEHLNWISNYKKMLRAVGISESSLGYMVHEAAEWSDFHKRWFFLPRRVSFESYDEKLDEQRGSNVVISASEDFSNVEVMKIGNVTPPRGFSSVKFIPGRPNELIALKSEETDDGLKSYIMVFNLEGKILLPETKVIDDKMEGLEIA